MDLVEKKLHITTLAGLLALALFLATACASKPSDDYDPTKTQRVVDKALAVLKDFQGQKRLDSLMELIGKADGVAILPETSKGAFLYGAKFGEGVILARSIEDGAWSYPAFCTLGDASAGVQIGLQSGPLVLVFLSDTALSLASDVGFSLGGDASVTVGPVTAEHASSTDTARRDIVYFWDPAGLFAGISLKGGIFLPQNELNAQYYLDPDATTHRIVIERKYEHPGAQPLVDFLDELSTEDAIPGLM